MWGVCTHLWMMRPLKEDWPGKETLWGREWWPVAMATFRAAYTMMVPSDASCCSPPIGRGRRDLLLWFCCVLRHLVHKQKGIVDVPWTQSSEPRVHHWWQPMLLPSE